MCPFLKTQQHQAIKTYRPYPAISASSGVNREVHGTTIHCGRRDSRCSTTHSPTLGSTSRPRRRTSTRAHHARVCKTQPRLRATNYISDCERINCGEGEDVVGVHTLLSGVVQACHELLVGEEEEKEEEQRRQEEKEVKREGQSEENTRTWMTMWMV